MDLHPWSILGVLGFSASLGKLVHAANSFAGSNLYYAAGLSPGDRETLLRSMEDAGMKVLRIWLDGQSTGTTITSCLDLEPNGIDVFDDTVLELLDDFMLVSRRHGIELMISMHSFDALEGEDVYGALYGTGFFYEWENATSQFDNRLQHILNHKHKTLRRPWKELSEYTFTFEAENEAMIGKVCPFDAWHRENTGVILWGREYIEDHQGWWAMGVRIESNGNC